MTGKAARKCGVCKKPTLSTTGTCDECQSRYDRIYGKQPSTTPGAGASVAQATSAAPAQPVSQETPAMAQTQTATSAKPKTTAAKAPSASTAAPKEAGAATPTPAAKPAAPAKPGPGATERDKKEYYREYNKRMAQLSPAKRAGQKLATAISRLEAILKIVRPWSTELEVSSDETLEQANALLKQVQALPVDFAPPRKKGGAAGLAEGAVVDLVEKWVSKYVDIIEEEERKGLVVIKAANGKVVARTVQGVKVVLPRGHVAPQAAAPAQAEA